ncbi:hypothetical protein PV371_15865 [Streptomyces sp. TX20-6-3]|uniref:hypothetical protein n=1 Tax=Streptomyces sp. TX20-6-3 TaxID=3028705 RepID=UPI0029BA0F67|nr:hypothetical protein [Streptomyces sp. TX20-6-3]MDX2561126.1 hypothetical protein [Streptomyces sp. TX20-6-3]
MEAHDLGPCLEDRSTRPVSPGHEPYTLFRAWHPSPSNPVTQAGDDDILIGGQGVLPVAPLTNT